MNLNERKLGYDDVLITPCISELKSRDQVYLVNFKEGIGIVCANMDGIGNIRMAKTLAKHKIFCALTKYEPIESIIEYFKEPESKYCFYSMGITDEDYKKFQWFYGTILRNENRDYHILVNIDVANGYMTAFHEFVAKMRKGFPSITIMAGTVCDVIGVKALCEAGADIIRGPISQGNQCLSANKAGVGNKVISFALESMPIIKTYGKKLCLDGSVKEPADFCKGFAAGASLIMAGSFFAGTEECVGEWEYEYEYETCFKDYNGTFWLNEESQIWSGRLTGNKRKKSFKFYGNASKIANEKHNGGLSEYKAAEGKESLIPYKGSVDNLCLDVLGSLRSVCTYTNSRCLRDLSKNAKLIRI